MKKFFFVLSLIVASNFIFAQKYFTKTGKVKFESKTKMELIQGENNKAASVYDASTGAIEWSVLVKAFAFEKALMGEHFNENYMESTKFPKAIFKGKIANNSAINLAKDGTYTADVAGTLEMHGVKKNVTTKATFTVKSGKISTASTFKVLLADYGITVPSVVKDNVSKEVEIQVSGNYEPLKK